MLTDKICKHCGGVVQAIHIAAGLYNSPDGKSYYCGGTDCVFLDGWDECDTCCVWVRYDAAGTITRVTAPDTYDRRTTYHYCGEGCL